METVADSEGLDPASQRRHDSGVQDDLGAQSRHDKGENDEASMAEAGHDQPDQSQTFADRTSQDATQYDENPEEIANEGGK